jgi:hypothetical protein
VTDDQDGFTAPLMQPPTPRSIQAAGVRLYAYAVSHNYPKDQPILEMPIADDVEEADELRKAQRLCRWFLSIQ